MALGFPPSTFLMLAGGLLSPPKGLETAIAALPAIRAAVPGAVLLIAGLPHPRLGAGYVERLRAAAAALGCARWVVFQLAFAPQERVEALHAAADVFLALHTSAEQTSSGTLLMALAAGAAVVATPFVQAAEMLAPAGAGVLVPFGDAPAVAAAVVRIATHAAETGSMRMRAAAAVGARAWAAVGARHAALAAQQPPPLRDAWSGAAGPSDVGARAFSSPSFTSAAVVEVGATCARNAAWVDGVGPGWRPVDTTLWSARADGWGVTSFLLGGGFASYESGMARATVRVLDDLSTASRAHADAAGGAWLAQRWVGALGDTGVRGTMVRELRVHSDAPRTVNVAVSVTMVGAMAPGANAWHTMGLDQLSADPGVVWHTCAWAGAASGAAHACAWDRAGLMQHLVTSVTLTSNALTVHVTHLPEVTIHLTCAAGSLQSIQFDQLTIENDGERTAVMHFSIEFVIP